jgi:hypothetical protein
MNVRFGTLQGYSIINGNLITHGAVNSRLGQTVALKGEAKDGILHVSIRKSGWTGEAMVPLNKASLWSLIRHGFFFSGQPKINLRTTNLKKDYGLSPRDPAVKELAKDLLQLKANYEARKADKIME